MSAQESISNIDEEEDDEEITPSDDPVVNLLQNYHSLNANVIDELHEEPSPLEFMRYVARNRPFVVRKAAVHWPAYKKWNAKYLNESMGECPVKVVSTPKGNADAPVRQDDGTIIFVEPHETFEPFSQVLAYIQTDTHLSLTNSPLLQDRLVKYAQTQNDNLRNEYAPLSPDLPPSIPFARIALSTPPDAINLWLGNHRSTTSLHKDQYENIYVQIRGRKHFALLPPISVVGVDERELRRGRYVADDSGRGLRVEVEEGGESVPVAMFDPDVQMEAQGGRYRDLMRVLRVTLDEGDMLYLPAMWYHKVSQTGGEEGFVCAVNYWYDMEYAGQFWSANTFVRDVVREQGKRVQYPDLKTKEEGS